MRWGLIYVNNLANVTTHLLLVMLPCRKYEVMNYTKLDMCNAYIWNEGEMADATEYMLDSQTLKIFNGFCVLEFANFFLDIYNPKSNIEDLHKVEKLLVLMPTNISTRKDIANWLVKVWQWYGRSMTRQQSEVLEMNYILKSAENP